MPINPDGLNGVGPHAGIRSLAAVDLHEAGEVSSRRVRKAPGHEFGTAEAFAGEDEPEGIGKNAGVHINRGRCWTVLTLVHGVEAKASRNRRLGFASAPVDNSAGFDPQGLPTTESSELSTDSVARFWGMPRCAGNVFPVANAFAAHLPGEQDLGLAARASAADGLTSRTRR